MEPVGFAAQPFDAVAVDGLFEMTGAGPETSLQWGFNCTRRWLPWLLRRRLRLYLIRGPGQRLQQETNLEWKEGKAPSFPENPFDQLAALEFFLFCPGKLSGDIRGGLFQFRFVRNSQFLTTLFTTASQNFTAVGGLHPLAETVNALAATSMWLKCTFHVEIFYV